MVAGMVAPRKGKVDILDAVTAARTMFDLAEQSLQTLVDLAREEGHTWQEIGESLGTTRQAAFQRFSR
jgi:hypothetical protein